MADEIEMKTGEAGERIISSEDIDNLPSLEDFVDVLIKQATDRKLTMELESLGFNAGLKILWYPAKPGEEGLYG